MDEFRENKEYLYGKSGTRLELEKLKESFEKKNFRPVIPFWNCDSSPRSIEMTLQQVHNYY